MTTIVLIHPNDHCQRFHVFAVYEAPNVHHAFDLEEISSRDDAEHAARQMMKTYEADHFRRIIKVGERIG